MTNMRVGWKMAIYQHKGHNNKDIQCNSMRYSWCQYIGHSNKNISNAIYRVILFSNLRDNQMHIAKTAWRLVTMEQIHWSAYEHDLRLCSGSFSSVTYPRSCLVLLFSCRNIKKYMLQVKLLKVIHTNAWVWISRITFIKNAEMFSCT